MKQKTSQWPTTNCLNQIADIIQLALDESITWKLFQSRGINDENCKSCVWERDASKPLRHGQHFLEIIQLQVKFCPINQVVFIEFIGIPKGDRGKGIGKEIVEKLISINQKLGYNRIILFTVRASESFWLKRGFVPVVHDSNLYPKRMLRKIS